MDWKLVGVTFGAIFLAELGDKTQLATFLMTAKSGSPWAVFLGSSLALVLASLLGVLAGEWLSKMIPPQYLQLGAATGFVVIGCLMFWQVFRGGS
ncbi:TMEM165/GDT1 family protein [Gloeobacter kilaueensis]|uniref:GDT1 family protein n=1 Tax=Gloeobacter kilaueensis (strain ATCC BAA-2537 / CCAP 1431/1 / ULC 316 / JS1) TaxID=1183438 RepID=U5QHF6_GLOK1|nr:TMEM165/GDT1 family protein [Gloeobacter kilaueensis]AGY57069.1 hypothetical protein GKIL_0823 [Gloeobacter kilaueensis JS1]